MNRQYLPGIMALMIFLVIPAAQAALTDGILFYYSFDNNDTVGSVAVDASNTVNATIHNVDTGAGGKVGEAYRFDSLSDAVNVTWDLNSTNFTFTAWLNFTALTANGEMFGVSFGGAVNGEIGAYGQQSTPDRIVCRFINTLNAQSNAISPTFIQDSWVFFACRNNGTTLDAFINASKGTPDTTTGLIKDWGNKYRLGSCITGCSDSITGLMDEVGFWNRSLSDSEITQLYNSGAGLNPFSITPEVELLTPVNGDHLNDQPVNFTYNLTISSGTRNCTLIINDTVNDTSIGLTTGVHNFSANLDESVYTWSVNCTDGNTTEQPTAFNLVVDRTTPDITVRASNFFSTDNTTVIYRYFDGWNVTFNLSFDDSYLWAYDVRLINSTGALTYQYVKNNLTTAQEEVENTTNLSPSCGAARCQYQAQLYLEDDHTAKAIPPYTHGPVASGYEWTTDTGVTIEVTAPGSTITTEKELDRYTFSAAFASPKASVVFLLRSTEELYHRGDLYPFPSFVTGKHWVDFNTDGLTGYNVTRQNYTQGFYRYQVHLFKNPSQTWHFDSLGGLNSRNETYLFNVSNQPRIAQNVAVTARGFDWLYINWTVPPESNHTMITRNGNNLANTSNLFYNDTGLNISASYTYSVFTYSIEGGKHPTINSTNTASDTTRSNTSLTVYARDLETNELLTNLTAFLFATRNYNASFNQSVNFTQVDADNYTLRVDKAGYSTYITIIEVQNSQYVNVTAYLSDTSTQKIFYVVTVDKDPIIGATVRVIRESDGALIDQKVTDLAGTVFYYLDESSTYRINVTATDFISYEELVNPVLDTYTIALEAIASEAATYLEDFTYIISPDTVNATITNFSITVAAPAATGEWAYLAVTINGTTTTDNTSVVQGGTANVTVDLTGLTGQTANAVYMVKGSSFDEPLIIYRDYYVFAPEQGNYTFASFMSRYGDEWSTAAKAGAVTVAAVAGGVTLAIIGGPTVGAMGAALFILIGAWFGWLGWAFAILGAAALIGGAMVLK